MTKTLNRLFCFVGLHRWSPWDWTTRIYYCSRRCRNCPKTETRFAELVDGKLAQRTWKKRMVNGWRDATFNEKMAGCSLTLAVFFALWMAFFMLLAIVSQIASVALI